MKTKIVFLLIFLIIPFFLYSSIPNNTWIVNKHKDFDISYTLEDKENIKEYGILIENGINTVKDFFGNSFPNDFNIRIHPNRLSLDSTWQKDWNMPNFNSQCWMVASGVSDKLDIISPKQWHKEACEHNYANKRKTQQLITHELIHVYHGQINISHDFSDVHYIDWFIEGLATYASGQCDAKRIADVKKALEGNNIPTVLDQFWSGKLRYGLSGTLVMYLDNKYGREKLIELLRYNDINDILQSLNLSEPTLINEWIDFAKQL